MRGLGALRGLTPPCYADDGSVVDCSDPSAVEDSAGNLTSQFTTQQTQLAVPIVQSAQGPDQVAAPYGARTYPNSVAAPVVLTAIRSALTTTPPRPSPTVAVPLTTSTLGLWLSNNLGTVLELSAFFLIGGVLLSGGRRRR